MFTSISECCATSTMVNMLKQGDNIPDEVAEKRVDRISKFNRVAQVADVMTGIALVVLGALSAAGILTLGAVATSLMLGLGSAQLLGYFFKRGPEWFGNARIKPFVKEAVATDHPNATPEQKMRAEAKRLIGFQSWIKAAIYSPQTAKLLG